MLHLLLHLLVPAAVAAGFYRRRWMRAVFLLLATWLVDLDHLVASPVYDPERCSIGFHPLHEWPVIALYLALFAGATAARMRRAENRMSDRVEVAQLVGLGLLIHMALDGLDCVT